MVLNAYFVSDLHIGSPSDSRARLFLEFLKNLGGGEDASHLFLMGDIFDLWVAAHSYFVDKYQPITDEIGRPSWLTSSATEGTSGRPVRQ